MSPEVASPSTDLPSTTAARLAAAGSYTAGEVQERIRLYMGIGCLSSLIGQLADLASMQDAQLAGISPLRWTIKIALLCLGAVLAAINAKRAAIDRSTSAPGTAPVAPALPTP